jgi:hypothetical protein
MLPVIISFGNIGYLDFCKNLLLNFNEIVKHHKIVFYCLDKLLYDALQSFVSERIEIVLHNDVEVSSNFVNFDDSPEYVAIMRQKTRIIYSALETYSFIHFVDSDVVFCKEPTEEYYEKYNEYDIVYQRDAPVPNEHYPFHEWTCAGNFVLRNTEQTRTLLKLIQSYQDKHNVNDQECQRRVFLDAGIRDIRKYPHAKLYEFPMEEFTCGYYINNAMVDPANVMVFHANWVVGNNAKRELLRKIGKWYL